MTPQNQASDENRSNRREFLENSTAAVAGATAAGWALQHGVSAAGEAAASRPTVPQVLSIRERDAVTKRILEKRLDSILPVAMRENGFDMWLILCQEDNYDPIHDTMTPLKTWRPILQILLLFDRGPDRGVERINLSITDMLGLFDSPWKGKHHVEQWPLLRKMIEERDPKKIGINIGRIQWAGGALSHNLYRQLVETLPPKYVERLDSAEPMAIRWAATLTEEEIELYAHVVDVARSLIAECFSRKAIVPGATTVEDLAYYYWQLCLDRGLEPAWAPSPGFKRYRSDAATAQYGPDDPLLRPGDFVRCDLGIKYLRLITDMQQWAYLLPPGETEAPEPMRRAMAETNRLQDVFMDEFHAGLTGNQILANILARARREGIPNPKIYSHSLGLFLHEPGPLIGLPWEQERCEGRGDVPLRENNAFAMELSTGRILPEWSKEEIKLALEENVVFTRGRCRLINGRQTRFHLV
jgi:Xaa-Pro aminopeptidase